MQINSSERAELRKEHGVCAALGLREELAKGPRMLEPAGSCSYLFYLSTVPPCQHDTGCQRVGVRLRSEAAEQTHTSHQVGEGNSVLHPPTSPLSHSM